MKKQLRIISFVIFICLNFHSHLFSGNFYMDNRKEKIANYVLNQASKEISCKYNMSCIGNGGAMMYEIEHLKLTFCINRPIEKKEARKIIVDAAEIFLKTVNNNQHIQKYLINYPYDLNNISISVIIHNTNGTTTYHPQLAVVSIVRGIVRFKTNDTENEWLYKETIEEPYEDATRILEEQRLN